MLNPANACSKRATWGQVNGEARDIQKDPKTGDGMKKSATGLLRVEKEGDKFVLYDQQSVYEETLGELQIAFADGKQYNAPTFAQIVDRLKQS